MGDGAEDARHTEELWEELWHAHDAGMCDDDCPFCDPEFEPLFSFQCPRK
jgi:hypothetical protein